jgi:hypothetical protein
LDKMMVDDIGVCKLGKPRRAVPQLLTTFCLLGYHSN